MTRDLAGTVLLVAIAVASCAAAQPATQPSTQSASPEIESLIAQLSDKQWKIRQQAQDRLVAVGDAAVERLKRLAGETADEEVRTRAKAALAQIAANAQSGPTLITLHVDQAPLATVLNDIARQSNVQITTWPPLAQNPNASKVTLNVDHEPFWAVIREISRQTGLSPERIANGSRITLMVGSGQWLQKPFSLQDSFLVVAESSNLAHNINFAQAQNIQSSFTMQFRAYIDPKIRILRGTPQLVLEDVVDEKGNSLVPPSTFAMGYSSGWGSRWLWDLQANLKYQPDIGKRIARFRASARFVIQSKVDCWEITNVMNAKDLERPIPLGKYILRSFAKSGDDHYTAQISVEHGRPNNFGQPFGHPLLDFSVIQQSIRVLDSQGRALMAGGGGGGNSSVNRTDYTLNFHRSSEDGQPTGEPAKLIWEIPLEVQEISVPVKFDNLPIP